MVLQNRTEVDQDLIMDLKPDVKLQDVQFPEGQRS